MCQYSLYSDTLALCACCLLFGLYPWNAYFQASSFHISSRALCLVPPPFAQSFSIWFSANTRTTHPSSYYILCITYVYSPILLSPVIFYSLLANSHISYGVEGGARTKTPAIDLKHILFLKRATWVHGGPWNVEERIAKRMNNKYLVTIFLHDFLAALFLFYLCVDSSNNNDHSQFSIFSMFDHIRV